MAKPTKGRNLMKAKKKADAETSTKRNKQLNGKSYPKAVPLSSLKEQIGELLLLFFVGEVQSEGLQQFEELLRQFYEGGIV